MTLDETIKHAEKIAEENQRVVDTGIVFNDVTIDMLYCDDTEIIDEHLANYQSCAEEYRQIAEWLKELRVFKSRKGQWLRMSDLSEQEDDRYKCSHCGNVVHYKDKMNLYTFNRWCGRCGSNNERN